MEVERLIEAAGGQSLVALRLGLSRQAVHIWCRDNLVSAYHAHELAALLGERGLTLDPALVRKAEKRGPKPKERADAKTQES